MAIAFDEDLGRDRWSNSILSILGVHVVRALIGDHGSSHQAAMLHSIITRLMVLG